MSFYPSPIKHRLINLLVLSKFQAIANKVSVQAQQSAISLLDQAENTTSSLATSFNLETECKKAAIILKIFLANPELPDSALNSIPKEVLLKAKGLAVFTILKAGFVWSGRIGSGIVIARLEDGSFSAPSAIATGGVGFGLQIGAEVAEVS